MASKVIKGKDIQKNQIINVGGAILKVKSVNHNKSKKVVVVSFFDTNMKQPFTYEEDVTIAT